MMFITANCKQNERYIALVSEGWSNQNGFTFFSSFLEIMTEKIKSVQPFFFCFF